MLSPDLLHRDVLSPDLLHGDVLLPVASCGEELPVKEQRYWEFEELEMPKLNSMAVKGRLRRHVEYWVHCGAWCSCGSR